MPDGKSAESAGESLHEPAPSEVGSLLIGIGLKQLTLRSTSSVLAQPQPIRSEERH
jgi:hypothetical protein